MHVSTLLEWVANKARKIPVPILDVIVGPVQAQALIAAVRYGLFRELAQGPLSQAELAQRCKVDEECLGLVARVVRAMGYLELDAGAYRLSATGRYYFGPDAPEPYSDFVAFGLAQWGHIARMSEVLTTGKGIDLHEGQSPEEWQMYQRAMAENAAAFSWFVVDNCPVPEGARNCLDIAGSHGIVSAALARKHPPLRSTILELKEAIPFARQIAEERGLLDIVEYKAGNLLRDSFGVEDVDVALMCNILHHFSADTNRDILKRVHRALQAKGTAAIFDIETPPPDARPESASDAFSLFFRVTSTSACFNSTDYESWLRDAGFASVYTVRSVRMPSRILAVGLK